MKALIVTMVLSYGFASINPIVNTVEVAPAPITTVSAGVGVTA